MPERKVNFLVKTFKRLFIKTLIFIILMILMNATKQAVEPIINNAVALGQLEFDNMSYIIFTYCTYLKNYGWIVSLLIFAIIYGSELGKLVSYILKEERESNL